MPRITKSFTGFQQGRFNTPGIPSDIFRAQQIKVYNRRRGTYRLEYGWSGMNLGIMMTGASHLSEVFDRLTRGARETAAIQSEDAARQIFGWSQNIVPYDTGMLQSKGYIRKQEQFADRDDIFMWDVGYDVASQDMAYGWYVHEATWMKFKTPGTQAKYLEIPYMVISKDFPDWMASHVSMLLKSASAGLKTTPQLGGLTATPSAPRLVKR